jgi:hypothetical protein
LRNAIRQPGPIWRVCFPQVNLRVDNHYIPSRIFMKLCRAHLRGAMASR